jgi:hypothetical protein
METEEILIIVIDSVVYFCIGQIVHGGARRYRKSRSRKKEGDREMQKDKTDYFSLYLR